MSERIRLIDAFGPRPSPARTREPQRALFRIGAVQERWHADPQEHADALAAGVYRAADAGAELICLQELTLSRYFAVDPRGPAAAGAEPEELPGGPTYEFAARMAGETGAHVHASLYERTENESDGDRQRDGEVDDGLGFNTAIVVAPDGRLVARTRKLHIPVTAGYHEDRYFRPAPPATDSDSGAPGGSAFPLLALDDARVGLPTCWDQWFPELARAYALAGADVLVYPTAIGSEPDHPDFDTQPLWQRVIVGNAIANGLFIVAVNRIGDEGPLSFYGSSFICDPYGRVVVQAPRDEPAVLVADLDLDERRDWLELFPFFDTRRPDAYASLVQRREPPAL
jgi:N-carbamoylputrescine amidase